MGKQRRGALSGIPCKRTHPAGRLSVLESKAADCTALTPFQSAARGAGEGIGNSERTRSTLEEKNTIQIAGRQHKFSNLAFSTGA